jgi:hypothetical protein
MVDVACLTKRACCVNSKLEYHVSFLDFQCLFSPTPKSGEAYGRLQAFLNRIVASLSLLMILQLLLQ